MELLVDHYIDGLLRFVMRIIGSREDAEDVVQDALIKSFERAYQFRGTPASFGAWLYAIAMNVGRAAVRKEARKLEQPGDLDAYAESSAPHMRDVIRDQTVQRALKQLSHDQREVIVLHWFEGLDFQEIANIVDASLSAVKVRAHRGYERLRALLGGIQ